MVAIVRLAVLRGQRRFSNVVSAVVGDLTLPRAVAPPDHPQMRWIAAAVAVLAFATPAAAQVPAPDDDPFYAVPSGLKGMPNGTVLDSRPIDAVALSIPLRVSAWQLKYKTRDNTGTPTATVTTIMVPRQAWRGPGPRPIVSYQTAEDGVGTKCAPSYALRAGLSGHFSNATPETLLMGFALQRGWTVVVPDYEGPQSQFLGGYMEGRGVLDGVRAARSFEPAGIAADAPVGLWGYSGGAVASAFAAQLQPLYAKKLRLAGVALGGVVADFKAVFKAFDQPLFGGALAIGLIGVDRSYPKDDVMQYIKPSARATIAASAKDCINDAIQRHPLMRAGTIEIRPNVIDEPGPTALLARISPLAFGTTPKAPVYEYHGVIDELAWIGPARKLLARYCAGGTPVQAVEEIGDHFTMLATGATGAMEYLKNRFAGKPVPNTCR